MIEQAVILCGGSGARLGALTAELPKPLLMVDESPFLDLLLFELGRHGIRRILLLAGFESVRPRRLFRLDAIKQMRVPYVALQARVPNA